MTDENPNLDPGGQDPSIFNYAKQLNVNWPVQVNRNLTAIEHVDEDGEVTGYEIYAPGSDLVSPEAAAELAEFITSRTGPHVSYYQG